MVLGFYSYERHSPRPRQALFLHSTNVGEAREEGGVARELRASRLDAPGQQCGWTGEAASARCDQANSFGNARKVRAELAFYD